MCEEFCLEFCKNFKIKLIHLFNKILERKVIKITDRPRLYEPLISVEREKIISTSLVI